MATNNTSLSESDCHVGVVKETHSPTFVQSGNLRDKVKLLVHELETNTVDSPDHFGWLHLRIKDLSLQECEAIVDGLKVNTNNVKWLDIAPIDISYDGLASVIKSLKMNTRITTLSLHGKPHNDLYGEEDKGDYLIPVPAQSLMEVLKVNKTLDQLTIADSLASDDDIRLVTNGLQMNTTLTEIRLANNPKLTMQSAYHLSELIKFTKTLQKVNFSGKPNINDEWVVAIADALKDNRSIKEVTMNDCEVGDAGARAFGEMLAENQVLTSLGLFNNQITDEGALSLADGLRVNSTLQTLSVGANQFTSTSAGGQALVATKTDTFQYLYLD